MSKTTKANANFRNSSDNGKNRRKNNYNGKRTKKETVCDVGPAVPNNPMWYAPNAQMLKDAASLPFSSIQGLHPDLWTDNLVSLNEVPFAGAARLNYMHSMGLGRSAADAATVGARYTYSYVRHQNSGHANYEAPDLYMYIMAWNSAAAVLTELKRMYGTMMAYVPRNRFYPATIVAAMGGDFQNLVGHLPELRSVINEFIVKLNSMNVPAGMPVQQRWQQLASEYYTDGKSTKSQLYVPKLQWALRWEQTARDTGTALSYYDVSSYPDIESIKSTLSYLIDPLLSMEDVGIMSGDIRKAYGENNCASLAMVTEDYLALPIASDEMLMQIHNTELAGPLTMPLDGIHCWQTPQGVIVSEAAFNGASEMNGVYNSNWRNYMLDMYKSDVTPEDVMVATRFALAPTIDPVDSSRYLESMRDDVVTLSASGSEIMLSIQISHNAEPADPDEYDDPYFPDAALYSNFCYRHDVANNFISVRALKLLELSAFNWAPVTFMIANGRAEGEAFSSRTIPLTNIENYTFVGRDVIARLHQLASLNLLASTVYTPFA